MDEGFVVFLMVINLVFLGYDLFRPETENVKIESGEKIKIENAVYECKKTQELILK